MTGITRQGKTVTIDFSEWYTQEQFAAIHGLPASRVRVWVANLKKGKGSPPIDTVQVPELNNMVLIRGKGK